MLRQLTSLGTSARAEGAFLAGLAAATEAARRPPSVDARVVVARVEREVRADVAGSFTFDGTGTATLHAMGSDWEAGRFWTPSLDALRAEAARAPRRGKARLFAVLGASPLTDIGTLQAGAGPRSLFQVASQWNCLESPTAEPVPVARYFDDSTQGPRASVSAFPGVMLRHYAAPSPDGRRFTQGEDRQVNLLEGIGREEAEQVVGGYLSERHVLNIGRLAEVVGDNFGAIRVGVHENVRVVFGHDWSSDVADAREGAPKSPGAARFAQAGGATGPLITQTFTSTLAAEHRAHVTRRAHARSLCTSLLRAGYLGTLLAARATGRRTAVLTLVGGGVFENPIPLIWECLLWAFDACAKDAPGGLDVVVNGRNLAPEVPPLKVAAACHARGGHVLAFGGGGDPALLR